MLAPKKKEKMSRRSCSPLHGHWVPLSLAIAVMMSIPSVAFAPTSTMGGSDVMWTKACSSTGLSQTFDDTSATSMPQRTAKHQSRKKRLRRNGSSSENGKALSEEELRQHVASEYIHGPGGKLRDVAAKSKRTPFPQNEQTHYLKKLERHPALVLNADYQPMSYLPLSMWNWQETIKSVFSGKVTVVDVYPDVTIRAATLEIPLPSVIALNEYVQPPNSKPAFTKRNVFLRDEYRCQYCSDRFHTRDLSLDHVVPRCRGGRLNWENAVTSCRQCNGRKGSLTLHQLKNVGMKLMREPFVPTQFQLHSIAGRMLPRKVHPTWAPYLGMADTLSEGTEFETETYMEEEL